jgi:hypothetical protein
LGGPNFATYKKKIKFSIPSGERKNMWPIRPDTDKSRGGFQNRDVGRSNFGDDFGPDYGTDYARYSDPPNESDDLYLTALISGELNDHPEVSFLVKNGFIILKGEVQGEEIKSEIFKRICDVPGVKDVINQLRVKSLL